MQDFSPVNDMNQSKNKKSPMSPPASILVLAARSDRWFSSPEAYAELLYLEGINDVETAYLEVLTPDLLDGRSLVLLGAADPCPDAVQLLIDFVYNGGGLICCTPGEALAKTLGLRPLNQGTMEGRLPVALPGYPEVGLPIKGWIQHYSAAENQDHTDTMALHDLDGHTTGHPAMIELAEGDGVILIMAYDPVQCVYLLRQGNPLLGGCRSSGFARMRPSDLFEGWQDRQTADWPTADLHCHFLRTLVQRAWPEDTVLPWLWYFPNRADTMLVFTSDDDWSTRTHFEQLIEACETYDARLTFYLVQKDSIMDRGWLESLGRRGFDFSVHPDLPPPSLPLWDQTLRDHVQQFQDTYGRPPSPSVRNHCITWSGYIEGARIEHRHGFTFDTNYFSLLPQGRCFMNGAGLPIRFADLSGDVLPVYQLPTQFSDETTLGGQGFEWSLNLSPDEGVALITGLMERNAGQTASMMCANAHPVSFATYSAPLWTPVFQFAQAHRIPVWDVERFSQFWQARRAIRLRPVPKHTSPDFSEWNLADQGLSVMLPTARPDKNTRMVCGRPYVMV